MILFLIRNFKCWQTNTVEFNPNAIIYNYWIILKRERPPCSARNGIFRGGGNYPGLSFGRWRIRGLRNFKQLIQPGLQSGRGIEWHACRRGWELVHLLEPKWGVPLIVVGGSSRIIFRCDPHDWLDRGSEWQPYIRWVDDARRFDDARGGRVRKTEKSAIRAECGKKYQWPRAWAGLVVGIINGRWSPGSIVQWSIRSIGEHEVRKQGGGHEYLGRAWMISN